MLGMIKRWVGQEPDSTVGVTHASLAALRTPLAPRYDAGLVASLTGDHRDLLERFVRIGRVAERGRLEELPPLLAAFKIALQKHLIEKNVRFYNYVENSLVDEENLRLIRRFRREMNGIARGLSDFLKKYDRFDLDESMRQPMLKEYAIVGSQLAQRLHREERSVFPLYQAICDEAGKRKS